MISKEKLYNSLGPAGGESPDEWYEREKTAFRAWWESEGEKTFSKTPTLAAGAGWFARAEAASETREKPCATCNDDPAVCATVPGLRHCEAATRETTLSEIAPKPTWKMPISIGSVQKDMKNGGEYVVAKAADGAWLGDFREKFAGRIIAILNASAPSATRRSAAADLGRLVEGWQAEEDAINRDAARWQAILWRWGSGTVTLDCADNGQFRLYVEHAEASDECHLGGHPEEVIDAAIAKELP